MKNLLSLFIFGCLSLNTFSQLNWHYVGSSSGYDATEANIEVGINGTLYLAVSDPNYSGKLTVKKWDNFSTSWINVGTPGIGATGAFDIQIKTDGGDFPTVAAKVLTGGNQIIEVFQWDGSSWYSITTKTCLTNHTKEYSLTVTPNDVPLLAFFNINNLIGLTNDLIVLNLSSSSQVGNTSFTGGNFNDVVSMVANNNDYPTVAWEHADMSNYLDLNKYDGTNWNYETGGIGDFPVKTILQEDNTYNVITTSWSENYLTNKIYTQDYTLSSSSAGNVDNVFSGGSSGGYFDYDYDQTSNHLGDLFFVMDGTNSSLIEHYLSNTPYALSTNFANNGTFPRLAVHYSDYVISYVIGNKVYVKESMETANPISTLGNPINICEQSAYNTPAGNNSNFIFKTSDDFYDHSTMTVTYTSQNTAVIPNANLSSNIITSSPYIGMNISGTNNVSSTTTVNIDVSIYFGGVLFDNQSDIVTVIVKTQPDITFNLPSLCTNDSPVNVSQDVTPLGGIWIIDGVNTNIYNPADCNCGSTNHILSYHVTVNGCQNQKDTTIAELNPPSFNITTSPASCGVDDGSAQVTGITGTTPFSYQWTTGSTTNSATNLSAGMYYATVTDAKGCKRTKAAAIGSSSISISGTVTPVECNGATTGAIDVTVTGGTGELSYYWTQGAYTQDLTNLSAGPYELSVTDASGCTSTASFIVPEPAPIVATLGTVLASCSANDGSVYATVVGGTSPYSYVWKNSLGTTIGTSSSVSSLPADGYTVTITDNNSCQKTKSVMLNNVAGPVVSLDTIIDASCSGNGMINISINTANTIVSTVWSDNSTSEDLTAPEGEYSVAVTDNNGCIGHLVADIGMQQPEPIEICMVTVDTNTITNLVLWKKPTTAVDRYNVYRETSQVGLYQLIDSVNYTDLTMYNDLAASPSIRSWRYKISSVNSCGAESELSPFHKTIHLTISQGLGGTYNLFWDDYEGFTYTDFELFRHTTMNGWESIQTMPTNLFSYTDTPPSTIGLDYMISIPSPGDCTPEKSQDYNSSRSNKANSIFTPPSDSSSTTGISKIICLNHSKFTQIQVQEW